MICEQGQCFLGVLTTGLFTKVFGFAQHGTRQVRLSKTGYRLRVWQPPLITLTRNLRDLPLDWVAGAVLLDASMGKMEAAENLPAKSTGMVKTKSKTNNMVWRRQMLLYWTMAWAVICVVLTACAVNQKRKRKLKHTSQEAKLEDVVVDGGHGVGRVGSSPTIQRLSGTINVDLSPRHEHV